LSYLGQPPVSGTFRVDYFSGTGSATTFNLSYGTGNEASVIVSIFGIQQQARTYSLNNGQLVFSQAPPVGTNNIEVRYLGEKVLVNPYLSADSYGIIRINSNVITENVSISLGYNASTTGPVTIANNRTVAVANGSVWKII
jgi:hypothetical protein